MFLKLLDIHLALFLINILPPNCKVVYLAAFTLCSQECLLVVSYTTIKETSKTIFFEIMIFFDGICNLSVTWNPKVSSFSNQFPMAQIEFIFEILLCLDWIKFAASLTLQQPTWVNRCFLKWYPPNRFHIHWIIYSPLDGNQFFLFYLLLFQIFLSQIFLCLQDIFLIDNS